MTVTPSRFVQSDERPRMLKNAVLVQAVLCALLAFATAMIWINYRHNLALTELAVKRSGTTYEARDGGDLLFAVAVTIVFLPMLALATTLLRPIWRGSRTALLTGVIGTGLLTGVTALVSLALWALRPFTSPAGDWDPPSDVREQYTLLAHHEHTHWYQWAQLSVPALAIWAALTLALLAPNLLRTGQRR